MQLDVQQITQLVTALSVLGHMFLSWRRNDKTVKRDAVATVQRAAVSATVERAAEAITAATGTFRVLAVPAPVEPERER